MHVDRKGTQLIIDLDKPEDVQGLYAVLTNKPETVSQGVFTHGQWLYNWLFTNIQKLATNFQQESSVVTQSSEVLARSAEVLTESPKRRGRPPGRRLPPKG